MDLIVSQSAARPVAKPETVKEVTSKLRDELVALFNKLAGAKAGFSFAKGKAKNQIKVVAGKATRLVDINSITSLKGKVQKASLKVGESNKILPVTTVTETRAKLTTLVNAVLKGVAGFEKIVAKAKPAVAQAKGPTIEGHLATWINANKKVASYDVRGSKVYSTTTKAVIASLDVVDKTTINITDATGTKTYPLNEKIMPVLTRIAKDAKPLKAVTTRKTTKAEPTAPKGKTTKAEPAKAKHVAAKPTAKSTTTHKVPHAHKQGKTTQPKVGKLVDDSTRMKKNGGK